MTRYVLGFAFSAGGSHVVLIKKNRGPEILHQKLNGVGGKINKREFAEDAMVREFLEETGVETTILDWQAKGYFSGQGWAVQVYTMKSDIIHRAKTCEDEEVLVVPVEALSIYATCPNVPALVSLCLNPAIRGFTWSEA